jgi:hypothetical protein
VTDITADTIAIEMAMQRLRQEQETFDQVKAHGERWFALRLRMGYVAVALMPTIAALCGYIVLNSTLYTVATVNMASGALLLDILGLLISVWKVVLNPGSVAKLSPVTPLAPKPRDRISA